MDCVGSRRDKKLKESRRIGLFGGSFDPPHLAHEALVEAAMDRLKLDEVWVIPAGVPVHRQLSGKADARVRMAWVERIFSDHTHVQVKDWEVDWKMNGDEPVAAISTLRRFKRELPDVTPLWLCGADSFAGMEQWVDYPQHQQLCSVAMFSRVGEADIESCAGWQMMTCEQWLQSGELQSGDIKPGVVVKVDAALPDISATKVRDMAVRGESLQLLVNSRICRDVESVYRR